MVLCGSTRVKAIFSPSVMSGPSGLVEYDRTGRIL